MAKTKKRRSKRKKHFLSAVSWRGWLWLSLVGMLLTITLYVVYLDRIITERFDGRRWVIPAQVYGRSLELFPDAPVDATRLKRELEGLGYRRVKHPDQPGSYSSYKGRFLLRTRPFHFFDHERSSDYLEIRFKNNKLLSIKQAASGKRLERYRLEPKLIGSLHPAHSEDRILLHRAELPEGLIKALIAVEDRNFPHHVGIDPLAVLRAILANLRAQGVVQGGSTLTQQLVKNFFLTPQRSLWRKFNEALMAIILEVRYTKDEILEAYANEIYLGQDGGRAIHGFGLASQFYFNRPLQELDLPKMALLVTLVRGPSAYNPRRHPERAMKRRTLVLQIMQQQGLISNELAKQAASSPLGIQKERRRSSSMPAFMDLVRRQIRRDYRERDLYTGGLHIFTTLDPWLQSQAEQALTGQLKRLEQARNIDKGSLQGALTLVDVTSGDVVALVGDRNPSYAGFNRALDAVRPVGSLIKPAVYLTALKDTKHYYLMSELEDKPIRLRGADGQIWSPKNHDRKSHGNVLLQDALAHSYNQATVHLGLAVGLEKVVETIGTLGIQRPLTAFPSLLLGAVSLSPLEITQMYQSLAAGGYLRSLRAIQAVTNAEGELLSRYPLSVKQVADPKAMFLLDHALQSVVQQGTGRRLNYILPKGSKVAGKTGTTDNLRDSWFAGYDQQHAAVAWVGRDDNAPIGLTGSSGAMQVWGDLMRRIGVISLSPRMPQGVKLVEIDRISGLLGEGCADTKMIPVIAGSGPKHKAGCAIQEESSLLPDEISWFHELFR